MDISISENRTRLFLVVSFAFCAVSLAALGLTFLERGRGRMPASQNEAAKVDARLAELRVGPRPAELPSERAMEVRQAIKRGDYATARQMTAGVLARSHLQNWSFYPFTDFIGGIANVGDPEIEAHLNAWVAQDPHDDIPLLIRAQYYADAGSFKRGTRFISAVRPENLASFKDYMTKASADINVAIGLNDKNPYSFYLKLRILRGLGADREMGGAFASAFAEGIAKHPGYFQLYDFVLGVLEPKWGGSVKAMYAFVDRYADQADKHSPLKLLYLSLYRDLLDSAAVACMPNWRDRDKMAKCIASVMQNIITPKLGQQVLDALALYDRSDEYQFGLALENIILPMLRTAGGDVYSSAMLQLAASAMHSDTQLKESNPRHNDYMIDKLVSESWYWKGFYDNALSKANEALTDIKTGSRLDDEQKSLAMAGVYDRLASVSDRLHQYIDMIAYEKAAAELGGITYDEHFICYAYYKLKDYDDALPACTKAIGRNATNLKARYWRSQVYRDLHESGAQLKDATIVADSEDDFRSSAAIDMSMIYFNRNDIKGALNVLNKYTYLYDSDMTSKSDVAVSYNNRCYAYMQLGELKKALDDCTASLKYGNIPDAYRKQEELVKRMASSGAVR